MNKQQQRTLRHVTTNDEITTFVVKCDNIAVARDIIAYANARNAETVVYRSQYDAERAAARREYERTLRQYAIASMRGDDAERARLQIEIDNMRNEHNFA